MQLTRNFILRVIHRHRFGERHHAALGSAVRRTAGSAEHARRAAICRITPTAAFFHFWDSQPRSDEYGAKIGIERPVPIVFGDLDDAAIGADAGAIDQISRPPNC
jgi:hypothetical protein